MKKFLALLVLFGGSLAKINPINAKYMFNAVPLFEEFMQTYNKNYSCPAEYAKRFDIFVENLQRANERNAAEGAEIHGVTQFMDLTPEEFKQRYLGFRPRTQRTNEVELADPYAPVARAVCGSTTTNCDYATLGAVTPVKDQGQCGSCWAFSATQAVETSWWFSGHDLPILAPQEIVDCDKTDGGCNGGDTPTAYEFVVKEGGLEAESSYPYTGKDGTCKFNASLVVAKISGYSWAIQPCDTVQTHNCDNQDEAGLWTFVQNQGPVSICVDAEPWQTYKSGIYGGAGCKHGYYSLDHCVHLTGYGTDNGQKYWLVKNSWGTSWGEKGYIRLAYGSNVCGVADEPTVAK